MHLSISSASAFMLALICGLVFWFRLQETPDTPADKHAPMPIHIGIVRPDGLFGLAVSPHEKILDTAVSDLHLPSACARKAEDINLANGMLLRFEETPKTGCFLSSIESLKGSARLVSGLRLNINNEDEVGLMLLPRIGPAKAAAIAASRAEEGPFINADDLTRVIGIGPKTVDKLAPWIEF